MTQNIHTKQIILESIAEFISDLKEADKEALYKNILLQFNNYQYLIDFLESDYKIIIESKKIKKDKNYLKKYISSFEQTENFYDLIGDSSNKYLMTLNAWLFNTYMNNYEAFTKLQSGIYTYFLANPNLHKSMNLLQKKQRSKTLSNKEQEVLFQHQNMKYLKKALEFFAYIPLTQKVLETSLSISLYKMIINKTDIKKHQLKEILETIFYKLDMPTTIQVDKMDDVYIKTVVLRIPIYAYPSTKDVKSVFSFEDIIAQLEQRIERYENDPRKKEKYETFLNNKILPKQADLGL